MRVLDRGLGLLAAAALAYAAGAAALAALRPDPAGPVAGPARAAGAGTAAGAAEPAAHPAEPVWPALFGTAPTASEPAAVVAETAPDEAPEVVLAGVIVGTGRPWALLDWGQGQSAAQVGDLLPADTRIADIAPEGVWLERAGLRWLVPAVPEGAELSVPRAGTGTPATQAAADEVTVPVGRLDRRALERLVARGGQVEDGADALVVTWVRAGQFFDRLGLKPGDSIIAINGQKVGGRAELTGAYDTAVQSGVMALEVSRGGAHRKIRVNLADI